MAKLSTKVATGFTATFTVNEIELRALDALSGYGADSFIKAFYDFLGKAYMEDHEAGLRQFLSEIRGVANGQLHDIDRCRALVHGCGKGFKPNGGDPPALICKGPKQRCPQCKRLAGYETLSETA